MSGDIDDIVDAAHDPKVTILVAPRAVAGEIHAFDLRPVLVAITLVIAVNCAQHRGPRFLNNKIATVVWRVGFAFASHRVSLASRKWLCRGTGFGRGRPRQRRDPNWPSLSVPPRIDDRTALFPDDALIPHPGFRVDWFADSSEQTQAGEIVLERPLLSPLNESANRRGRGVKRVHAMAFNDVPETIRLRPVGCALVHQSCRAIRQGAIDDITVAGDPTNVGRAPVDVFVL